MSIQKVDKTTGNTSLLAGSTLWADSPIGTILAYGGATAPSGWFLCDGTAISRTTYSELFAVIGTSFGVGDGSTTFNLPDMRESVPKGAGLTGKTVGAHLDADGLAVGEFLDDRMQEHRHTYRVGPSSGPTAGITLISQTSQGEDSIGQTGRYGPTTEVKSVGVNYIIKAKMVALPADFLAKVDEAVEEKATRFPDYAHPITIPNGTYTWTATEDCYLEVVYITSDLTLDENARRITIDGNMVGVADVTTNSMVRSFNGYIKKGQVVSSYDQLMNLGSITQVRVFPLS